LPPVGPPRISSQLSFGLGFVTVIFLRGVLRAGSESARFLDAMNAPTALRSLSVLAPALRWDAAAAYAVSLLYCRAWERCSLSAAQGSPGDPCGALMVPTGEVGVTGVISADSIFRTASPSDPGDTPLLGRWDADAVLDCKLVLTCSDDWIGAACDRRCDRAGRNGDAVCSDAMDVLPMDMDVLADATELASDPALGGGGAGRVGRSDLSGRSSRCGRSGRSKRSGRSGLSDRGGMTGSALNRAPAPAPAPTPALFPDIDPAESDAYAALLGGIEGYGLSENPPRLPRKS